VQKIVRCLLSLPLMPAGEIVQAVSNIRPEIADDGQHVEGLKNLVSYINKLWINKRSIAPERLSVRDNRIVALTILYLKLDSLRTTLPGQIRSGWQRAQYGPSIGTGCGGRAAVAASPSR